ncbi:MAG: T9SS type A sorting domain-containing protein [Bacteroidales bacterium]|nr:T9SS type A sorting domain-containing protein [Bacteroidales bacterium]MCF8337298.1 T9SS type A sorting domain-containing protein [Bacteroidales bacterium]
MRPLITLLLIAVFSLSQAQNGYQITDTTKQWNTVSGGYAAFAVLFGADTRINKLGDPVFMNDQKYFPLLESTDSAQTWYDHGYLREDTVNQKVYYYTAEDGDCLIYDFSLEDGDSVVINNPYTNVWDQLMVCDSVDIVTINGSIKKRLFFSSDVWIQGIGSVKGLACSGNWSMDHNELLCCYQNDEILYDNDTYQSCYVDEFYPNITTESYDTAYINTYYEFQMESENPYDDPVTWDPINLPNGLEINENTGIISGIPTNPGSQACIITIRNNLLGSRTDFINEDLFVVNATNTPENQIPDKISIYPNPADDRILVDLKNPQNAISAKVYAPSGRMVHQNKIIQTPTKIDCSSFTPGIYLVKIVDEMGHVLTNKKIAVK